MTEKKQNFKKVNFNQACKLKKICLNMLQKNPYYILDDFEHAWSQFEIEQSKIKNHEYIPMLKSGNLKINNKIGIFDLPAIVTCKYACKSCYALKSERIYKNTRLMRIRHLLHVLYAIYNPCYKWLFINNFINNCKQYKIIRLHGSGDFFNEKYLQIILQIINQTPQINYYTYSKILSNHRIDFINNSYNNFNIIKSMIELDNKIFINYGEHDYINNLQDLLKSQNKPCYICNYQNMEHGQCMQTCKACLYCSHVLFYKH